MIKPDCSAFCSYELALPASPQRATISKLYRIEKIGLPGSDGFT